MDSVLTQLYFADIIDAGQHSLYEEHRIDSVVKLTTADPENGYPESVEIYHHPLIDGDDVDPQCFEDAVNTVVEQLDEGETVLVHCVAGASRSSSVVAAVSAIQRGTEFDEELERIQSDIKPVSPHPTLVEVGNEMLIR